MSKSDHSRVCILAAAMCCSQPCLTCNASLEKTEAVKCTMRSAEGQQALGFCMVLAPRSAPVNLLECMLGHPCLKSVQSASTGMHLCTLTMTGSCNLRAHQDRPEAGDAPCSTSSTKHGVAVFSSYSSHCRQPYDARPSHDHRKSARATSSAGARANSAAKPVLGRLQAQVER